MWVIRICLFCLAAGTLLAQHEYSPADIEDGGRMFRASCIKCHGADGDAIAGIDLGRLRFKRATTDQQVINIIRNGIPGTAMPANPTISEFQAGAIVAYLRTMANDPSRKSTLAGDPSRGKTIFEGKGQCLNCHRVDGKGSTLGPDLSDVGLVRRTVQIERSILDPDAEILPQNRFFRVVTKDGNTITGHLLNQDTFTVQMLDSQERLRSFGKSDLKEYGFVMKSPMPSYAGKLSPQELADLVSYLGSLKGASQP